jgi:hypothetical protein
MTKAELLRQILRGRLLLVGEFRGARAELAGFVDKRTGDAISYVRAIYLLECACRGVVDRAVIRKKLLDIEKPEDVLFPYEKGKIYVFSLESFKMERGAITGWMDHREPELIEGTEDGDGSAVGGPAPP